MNLVGVLDKLARLHGAGCIPDHMAGMPLGKGVDYHNTRKASAACNFEAEVGVNVARPALARVLQGYADIADLRHPLEHPKDQLENQCQKIGAYLVLAVEILVTLTSDQVVAT